VRDVLIANEFQNVGIRSDFAGRDRMAMAIA